MPFTTEEITGCTNETAKGTNETRRNLPSCFFSCFTVSVTPINTSESSNDFIMILSNFLLYLKLNCLFEVNCL